MAGESDRRSRRNPPRRDRAWRDHWHSRRRPARPDAGDRRRASRLSLSHSFSPEPSGPAAQVSAAETVAAYDDRTALDAFGEAVDVVTVEFENVPASALERLAETRFRSGRASRSLQVAQNRVSEKDFVRGLGLETTPYAPIEEDADADEADPLIGRPAVLKTQTLGYDGKGQVVLAAGDDLRDAWYGHARRSAGDPRSAGRDRTRGLGGRCPRAGRRGGELRSGREPPRERHPRPNAGAGRRLPRSRRGRAGGRRAHRPGARPRRGSLRRTVRHPKVANCWSTRSPPASTIPAIGPSRGARPASSRSTSAPSAACRWAPLQGAPMPP